MIAWYEDCILFSYKNDDFLEKIHTLNIQYYEELLVENKNENVLGINYKWIDDVRVKDKIYSKEPLEVNLWIFNQEKIICCFGNSESAISYAIGKLSEKTSTVINKIEIFSIWKSRVYNPNKTENWVGELMSIHVKIILPINNIQIIKIPIKDLQPFEVEDYLNSNSATNLSFYFNNFLYFIDANSVISFSSTTNENQIYRAINTIVKGIANLK